MDGTNALIVDRVRLIDRVHFRAYPIPGDWPRLYKGDNALNSHFPRFFLRDICTGSDHLTLTMINNWRVTSGVFDPFSLFDSTLSRYENVNTQTTQTINNLQTNTQYQITVTGNGVISFSGSTGTLYSWGRNNNRFDNETKTVEFLGSPPTEFSVKVDSGDEINKVSMIDPTGTEMITNNDFTQTEEHFYDIEGWYVDSDNVNIVPPQALGYLQGFNDTQIFTIFE